MSGILYSHKEQPLIISFLTFMICVSLLGCSESNAPKLGNVEGNVTMDGNPMTNVIVQFNPQSGGFTSMARTDENGNYSLVYNGEKDGAIVGTHQVKIITPMDRTDPVKDYMDPIPMKYNQNSELIESVESGDNLINFALSAK